MAGAASEPFVRIAQRGETFIKVYVNEGIDVSELIVSVCADSKFSHWGANPGQVKLFLVADGGSPKPSQAEIDDTLKQESKCLDENLAVRGIGSGAWIVARVHRKSPVHALRVNTTTCFISHAPSPLII